MKLPCSPIYTSFFALVFLWATSANCQSLSTETEKADLANNLVLLSLQIRDGQSGLLLSATKKIASGSNALQILQDIVPVKYKVYPELGAFVTGLCGVEASPGFVWTFTVDKKWSTVGIGTLTLNRDITIEWETR